MQVQPQIDRLLAHQAAQWMEILKTGAEHDRQKFDRWLRQSPLHVAHFLEITALGRAIADLDPTRDEDIDAILMRIQPQRLHLSDRTSWWNRLTQDQASRRSWKVPGALAASILIGVGAFWLAGVTPWRTERIDTAIGEQRSVTLSDGSLVALNTASTLRIDYSEMQREVDLDLGEAVFKVTHDPKRPFEVHTRLATIRAIGTQFNVYQRPNDVLVSVLEGRIRVMSAHGADTQILGLGQEARVLPNGRIVRLARADVSKTLAWRQRRLSFDEAPLEEIVREFNRYNAALKFRIEGVPNNAYHFGGIYDAGDPESLAQVLEREPGLVVERRKGEILVRGKYSARRGDRDSGP